MPLPADYLIAGPLIMQRLRDEVRDLRKVMPLEELALLPEDAIASPMAYVLYDGDEVAPGDSRARQGASQIMQQRWMVVLGVRNARQIATGRVPEHEAAGPLISRVIRALAGWQCEPFRAPLFRLTAPKVQYGKNFALFPLMFAGELVTS